ncbi:MAG TPA: hypothetical protein VGN23_09130 [Verrucomicrobiae bacterium]|jgi:hypothetical protein
MSDSPDHRIGVNPRVCLLTLSTVRALRGCVTEKIKSEVESGQYLWVFDLSLSINAPDSRSQALRFWVADIAEGLGVKNLPVDAVVNQILPASYASFHSEDLCTRFSVNRTLLCRLRKRWGSGRGRVKREILADFLKSRWLGPPKPITTPQ